MGRWSVSEFREAHHGAWTFRRVSRPISRLGQNHREVAACEYAPSRRLSEATNFSWGFKVHHGLALAPVSRCDCRTRHHAWHSRAVDGFIAWQKYILKGGRVVLPATHNVRCFACLHFDVALVAFLIPALLSNERGFCSLRRAYFIP